MRHVPVGPNMLEDLDTAVGDRPVYFHLDCDVLEPGLVPTDYRVPNGLSLDELAGVASRLAENAVVGVEVAEFEGSWSDTGAPGDPGPLLDRTLSIRGRLTPDLGPPPRRVEYVSAMGSVNGKVALITGGANGVGAEVARRLHDKGAKLVLTDLDEVLLKEVATRLGEDRVLAAVADVRDLAAMQDAVDQGIDRFGGIDIVVANAGIATYGSVLKSIRRPSGR